MTLVTTLNRSGRARLIHGMEPFTCPICHQPRPDEYHLDWCTYDGPEPDPEDEDEDA